MKKTIGYVIAGLIIGTMIVLMVKSNLEKPEPIDTALTSVDGAVSLDDNEAEVDAGLGQGDVPPDFELTTIDGEVVKLSDLQGKKVILNFWATWCPPCKAEMPHMQNYYQNNKDEENVEIIAVNMTGSESRGVKAVQEFAESYGLTFPIPLDDKGKIKELYQVYYLPTTYMLETDGRIANKIVGPMDERTIEQLVENLD